MRFIAAAVMALVLAVPMGCAMIESSEPTARIAITAATWKAIDGDTERAGRIVTIADDAIAVVDGDAVATLDRLEQRVRAEVNKLDLDDAESLVADALIDAVRERLEERIAEGILDADDRVQVVKVLEWIRDAAAAKTAPG